MKPSKHKAGDKQIGSLRTKSPVSRRKLWAFRIIAMLLPVLVVLLLETVLRVVGYGYDTSFLKKAQINGAEYFINNDTFSLRFFPPSLARWPGTLMIPAKKDPQAIRIFIFGESN